MAATDENLCRSCYKVLPPEFDSPCPTCLYQIRLAERNRPKARIVSYRSPLAKLDSLRGQK